MRCQSGESLLGALFFVLIFHILFFVYTKIYFHPVKLMQKVFISQSVVILHKPNKSVREVIIHKK